MMPRKPSAQPGSAMAWSCLTIVPNPVAAQTDTPAAGYRAEFFQVLASVEGDYLRSFEHLRL